jgi:hypothetical protein
MSKIIYYYQNFIGLDDLLSKATIPVTHIHVSSIHFGLDYDGNPYIHLNDLDPTNDEYASLWKDLKAAVKKNIKIVLMIGGAGGAYDVLFSNYDVYKKLLFDTITEHIDIISGIDLDIEEFVDIKNVIMFINDIKNKFSTSFSISMAPIQQSIETDCIGMGGFCYKKLYKSNSGHLIDYFCVQFYNNFDDAAFDNCVNNGYPPKMLVMGMLTGMNYSNIRVVVNKLAQKYGDKFGGVYNWEYYNSPPYGRKNPAYWALDMYNQIYKTPSIKYYIKKLFS